VKPDTFAAVMATGIVSIAAADHRYLAISKVLIVLAAVALPVLIVAAATAWRRESWDLTDLDVSLRLCTYVAACAVVGARLAEHRIVLWVLAGMALQGWLSLVPVIARRMWRDRWAGLRDRAHGGGAVLGHRDWRVPVDDGTGCLAGHRRSGRPGVGAARHVDPDGRRGDRDVGGRSYPQGRTRERSPRDGCDVVRRDGVAVSADLPHCATFPQEARASAGAVVGGGVPAWDVLGRDVCHGRRNRLAVADGGVAGVLLDRVRGVGHRR
jgi:hypothetical protein